MQSVVGHAVPLGSRVPLQQPKPRAFVKQASQTTCSKSCQLQKHLTHIRWGLQQLQQHESYFAVSCNALSSDSQSKIAQPLRTDKESPAGDSIFGSTSSIDGLSVHLSESEAVSGNVHSSSRVAPVCTTPPSPTASAATAAAAAATDAAAVAAQTSEAIAKANEETSAVNRLDIYKAIGISGAVSVFAGVLAHEWVDAHQGLAMSLLFCLGYIGIMVEELVGLNKAGVALLMAVSLWTIRSTAGLPPAQVDAEVAAALSSVSELIFFILGAMTIVEVVDCHGGFKRLASWVKADERKTLACGVGLLSFCMSAVLDNLTSTILMLSILQRANPNDPELRKLLGAIVVIAANAGGAWTPIGDVTTTMLWVNGQITPLTTMQNLLVPSLVALAVPLALLCATAPELQGPVDRKISKAAQQSGQAQQLEAGTEAGIGNFSSSGSSSSTAIGGSASGSAVSSIEAAQLALQASFESHVAASSSSSSSTVEGSISTPQPQLLAFNRDLLVLWVGLGSLLFVPLFKYLTNLPPYMGMLSGLAVLWMVTDALHFGESRSFPRVQDALRNVDITGVMFFMGVLMSVEALNAAGLLGQLAETLNGAVPNVDIIAASIGLVSALVDNVPLVAATQGMYDVSIVPPDSQLWQLIALCAGTGGSLLVIGSAAGVAYMTLEGAGFMWYLKKVSPWALLGYGAAICTYIALRGLPSSTEV